MQGHVQVADRTRPDYAIADWSKDNPATMIEEKKATILVHAKRGFNLVVRLIANKCYEDTFYFLSFLPTVLRLSSLASHIGLITSHQIICGII